MHIFHFSTNKSMDRWIGKIAIVTGASSGIGKAIAEELTIRGMLVVGLARRVNNIKILASQLSTKSEVKGQLHAIQCDMTKPNEILKAFAWTSSNLGLVHVLINNAGCNPGTDILQGSVEDWRTCFEVNVIGFTLAAREAAKIMVENNISGHIININSDLGHINVYVPTMSLYSASKHAVTNIIELLRQELNLYANQINVMNKVKVTSISPGHVDTEFINEKTASQLEEHIKKVCFLKPSDVVEMAINALKSSDRVLVNEIIITHREI